MSLTDIRNSVTLLIIGLYMVLNLGFMLVRIPPAVGTGVPFGELLLLLFLLTFVFDIKWLPHFSRSIFLLPFILWWSLGIGRSIAAVPEFGMWALRDATHVIESLFLWVGFVFAAKLSTVDRFFVWLRRVMVIGTIYAFTFPFREVLRAFSPTILAAAGYTTTIFFQYASSFVLVLMEVAHRLIHRSSASGPRSLLINAFLIVYVVAIFQARTVYLQVIVLMILFVWYRRIAFGKMNVVLMLAGLAFLAFVSVGVEISGRLGQTVSLNFIVNHFAAIWGREAEGVVSAARGVGWRLNFWAIIWRQVTDNLGSMLFGLGYGFPLIDFLGGQGQIVREPHNSYFSILGRTGFVGLFLFAWGHILLIRVWSRAFNLCRRVGYRLGQDRLLLLMVFFVLIWVLTMTEGAFESPYLTIPYYFFWGIVLHYGRHLRYAVANLGIRAPEPPQWWFGDQVHARTPGP